MTKIPEYQLKGINGKIKNVEQFLGINVKSYLEEKVKVKKYSYECLENFIRVGEGELVTRDMAGKLEHWDKEYRTNEQYFIDVLLAWTTEDHVMIDMKKDMELMREYEIEKSGTDANRHFIAANQANRTPDIRLKNKQTGMIIYLEIMEDNTSFVKRAGFFNLRDGKLRDLQAITRKPNVDMVFQVLADLPNKEYILYRINGKEPLDTEYCKAYDKQCTKTHIDSFKNIVYKNTEIGKGVRMIKKGA